VTKTIQVNLTSEEYEGLLLLLGYATGAAMKEGGSKLACSFLRIANAVGRSSPNFIPYAIPEDIDQPPDTGQ
jgi:hypothetical protein